MNSRIVVGVVGFADREHQEEAADTARDLHRQITTQAGLTEPVSWKMEVQTQGQWSGNALRYATEQEATDAGDELLSRWFVPTASRAVPSTDPVNRRFVDGRSVELEAVAAV